MRLFERLRQRMQPRPQPQPAALIVMRLIDMHRVHPDQIVAHCMECQHEVGIYPSGQRVIAEHPGIRVICQICKQAGPQVQVRLAPGALFERSQTVNRETRK